MGLGIGPML